MTSEVTDANFEKNVLQANGPVLVDFWAEWCGPCRMIAPALQEISVEMGDKIAITKMNIDDNPHTPTQLGIRSIPTLMLFKDGKLIDQRVGAMRKGDLQEWLDKAVS